MRLKKYSLTGIIFLLLCAFASGANAKIVQRVSGAIGRTAQNRPTFTIEGSPHKGTYFIINDIKGVGFYKGAHVIALDADLTDSTIEFEKFEWKGLKDFMLAPADMLPGWELSKKAPEREIPTTLKLPALVQPAPTPLKGIAQRILTHSYQVMHALQIRYYEFGSSSEAAMFAERWSSYKGVARDTSEHFRRSYDRFAVWVVNADDDRKPPDYWQARFVLEALFRKTLITFDTSEIFTKNNSDPVLFHAKRDTVTVGDTLSLVGQGFSPFLEDNVLLVRQDTVYLPLPTLSVTSRELTTTIPWSFLTPNEKIRNVSVLFRVHNYMQSNPISFYVKSKE